MKKFDFVFVSKDENFKMSKEMTSGITTKYNNVTFNYISNNKDSLANVYNKFINKHRSDKDIDYLILMHADVLLNIENLLFHIEEVDGKYDALGLCGCAKLSVSQLPFNWFCASRPYPEFRWGCVTHGELGNQTTFFSQHSPDVLDHEVGCIDGLCIILSKKVIEDTDLLFDPQFVFSHYDSDFSFECVLKRHLKLGVIVQKDLLHWSVGRSILMPEFLEKEKDFRKKWNIQVS